MTADAGSKAWLWPLLLVLACAPYLVSLGDPPLWDANEPLYAEPPREALESGDWLVPTWNGQPWFVHPPLSTWLTLPSYALFGVNEFAERLPMALAAIATILATFSLGKGLFGPRGGLVAALVLALTPRVWLFSRQLAGDVYLTAAITGAYALALPALLDPTRGRRRILLAHAIAGIGVLAKGPLVIAGVYALPLFLASRLARPRVPLVFLRPWAGTLLVAVLGLPWFAYMTVAYWPQFFQQHFGWNHWERMVSEGFGGRPPWFYVQTLLADAQPWVVLLPFAVVRAVKARERTAGALLPWLWLAVPFFLFSLMAGKRNVYLMPVYPAMALVLAPLLVEFWDGLWPRLARWGGVLAAAAAALGVVFLSIASGRVSSEFAAGSRPLIGVCAAAFVVLAVAVWRGSGKAVVAGVMGAMYAMTVFAAAAMPMLSQWMPVPRLAARLAREAAPEDLAIVYATSIHSLNFYARRNTQVARNPADLSARIPAGRRAFVLTDDDSAVELLKPPPADSPVRLTVREVERAPYLKFQFARLIGSEKGAMKELVLLEVTKQEGGGAGGR